MTERVALESHFCVAKMTNNYIIIFATSDANEHFQASLIGFPMAGKMALESDFNLQSDMFPSGLTIPTLIDYDS